MLKKKVEKFNKGEVVIYKPSKSWIKTQYVQKLHILPQMAKFNTKKQCAIFAHWNNFVTNL